MWNCTYWSIRKNPVAQSSDQRGGSSPSILIPWKEPPTHIAEFSASPGMATASKWEGLWRTCFCQQATTVSCVLHAFSADASWQNLDIFSWMQISDTRKGQSHLAESYPGKETRHYLVRDSSGRWTGSRILRKQEAVWLGRRMCWRSYFASSREEAGCPWWACCSQQRAWPAQTGLATPGWTAVHPPVGTCCSSGSISCCCTEPVMETSAFPREVGDRAFLLSCHSPMLLSLDCQIDMPRHHQQRQLADFSRLHEGWNYSFPVNLVKWRVQDHIPNFKASLLLNNSRKTLPIFQLVKDKD